MNGLGLSTEEVIKRLGTEKSVGIAKEISSVALKYGLSFSQTEAVFEIAKGLVRGEHDLWEKVCNVAPSEAAESQLDVTDQLLEVLAAAEREAQERSK